MSISTTRTVPRLIGLAGAFLLAIGAVMMYGTPGQASPHPLDDYPGFGRSPDAVTRDDTIAYFEAYHRERHIAGCMADAGFEYTPDVEYPLDAMRNVAASLDVDTVDADTDLAHPAEQNQSYEDALSADEREAYYQTLFGESADDYDQSLETKEIPHADFAKGGCYGEAHEQVGTVWEARRQLEPELGQMRDDIAESAELEQTRSDYQVCAAEAGVEARGPDELETALAEGVTPAEATDAIEDCSQIWAEGYASAEVPAAEAFVERNAEVLRAHADGYRDVTDDIAADEDFLEYLAYRVALGEQADVPDDVGR